MGVFSVMRKHERIRQRPIRLSCTPRVFVLLSVVALVLSIVIFAGLSHTFPASLKKPQQMTSACAHNPISHLRLRPDRDVLPVNVVPLKYDLVIKPDMGKFTFEGKVSIE